MNHRSRIYIAVQYDSDAVVDVVSGQTSPSASAFAVHSHINLCRSTSLRVSSKSLSDYTTIEGCFTITSVCFDSVELECGVVLVDTLNTPHKFEVAGQHSFDLGSAQHFVNSSGVVAHSDTNYGTRSDLTVVSRGVEFREQGELFLPSSACSSLVNVLVTELCQQVLTLSSSSLLGGSLRSFLACLNFCQLSVCLCKDGVNLVITIGRPELQRSGTLEKFTNTLGLFHAGELYEDTTRVLQTLDVGLSHTKAVDTATQYIERVCDSALRLGTQYADYIRVAGLGSDLLFELGCVEQVSERSAARDFVIGRSKSVDKVAAVLLSFASLCDSLVEHRILVVVRQSANYILNRDLKHYVHTTTQVKTKVDLFLLNLTIVEFHYTQVVNCFGFDRIQISLLFLELQLGGELCGILCRFALYAFAHESERKLVGTGDSEKHRQQFKCTFVLHCLNSVLLVFDCFAFYGMFTIKRKITKKLYKSNFFVSKLVAFLYKKEHPRLDKTAVGRCWGAVWGCEKRAVATLRSDSPPGWLEIGLCAFGRRPISLFVGIT